MDETVSSSLAEQVMALRSRVGLLEDALRSYGIVVAANAVEPLLKQVPGPPGIASQPAQPALIQQPSAPLLPDKLPRPIFTIPPQAEDHSLESRIGSQWFNRIGIFAVLIGMAWFLKLAIDNHWVGPLGRVLIGLLAGAGLIAWSERFQRRGYAAFSYSLKAVGGGILYLSLWAAFSLFHLIPAGAAFAAMVAVTAFNGFLSWREDSELLALYSIMGGLSTPVLVSTGGNHEVSLFSYLLILDLAVLILTMLRPWSRLLFGAFNGTALFVLGWYLTWYSEAQFGRTSFFVACFLFLFGLAPRLIRLDREEGRSSRWNGLTLVWMSLANAALTFLTFYGMLQLAEAAWAEPWLAVSLASFYLLLLRLPARTPLRESPAISSTLHLTMAIVFLSIAIPLKAHGRWLTIGWLIEGAALLWVASRAQVQRESPLVLRVLALLCLLLGLGALVLIDPPASITPLFNERFGTYLVAIAVFGFIALLARRSVETDEAEPHSEIRWVNIAAVAALLINGLILFAAGWEIHNYWWFVSWRGHMGDMHGYRIYAQFSYSALFMLFGAVLLGMGFWRRSQFVRWQALVLLAVAIGKVFLVDVSELSQGYRVLSFLGLGALLLAVSFVYQRDWLHLRSPEHQAQ